MLRIVPSRSAAAAVAYFSEGLKKSDYYVTDVDVITSWNGISAKMLKIEGTVEAETFEALVNNRNPHTGARLTARQLSEKERVPGWDFNFHAPKSLSILLGVTRDDRLLTAFRESVSETMAEIEKMASTRVRVGGKQEDRISGNLMWAEFVHHTSRPVNGVVDPHLHIHAWVINGTWDSHEQRWKAAKIHDIKVNAPYFEMLFHSKLADKIANLGYPTHRTAQRWEITGISRECILELSRRSTLINNKADQLGIVDPKQKAELGSLTRETKTQGKTLSDLRKEWVSRLTQQDRDDVRRILESNNGMRPPNRLSAKQIVDYAELRMFERDSVVDLRKFETEAMRFGVGQATIEGIRREMQRRGMIVKEFNGKKLVSTPAIVLEEVALIQRVRSGFGSLPPLLPGGIEIRNKGLTKEQQTAVHHLLKSCDQVIALRGKAGTGKTTLLGEVREQVHMTGKRLYAFSVTSEASRKVLREDGFEGAQTIAFLLNNTDLQRRVRGQVILIDEAGTIGIRDYLRILEIAGSSTKVLLAGDTGQHAPVARGDTLRLLEDYAGLNVAEVTEIHRQVVAEYKKAVKDLSEKNLSEGFARLDKMGAIISIPAPEERYRQLATDYAKIVANTGTPPLIVAPTHAEGNTVSAAIREILQQQGKLGTQRNFLQYRAVKWAEVDKEVSENYSSGLAVKFHQNVKGIRRGSIFEIDRVESNGQVWMKSTNGIRSLLDLSQAKNLRVFEIDRIGLARGDSIRITEGGKTADGRRLNNGAVYKIKGFAKDGSIKLTNGLILGKEFGHWAYGYFQTSHSAQGKKSPTVFVAHSARSFLASSHEGFYVSASRGIRDIRIYTDDKDGLRQAVGNSSQRVSGIEFEGIRKEDFVNGGLSGREWADRLAAARNGGTQGTTHVEGLNSKRMQAPNEQFGSWTQYVDMRRSIAGPDGRNRNRGMSGGTKAPRGQGTNEPPSLKNKTSLTDQTNPSKVSKRESISKDAAKDEMRSESVAPKKVTPANSATEAEKTKSVPANGRSVNQAGSRNQRVSEYQSRQKSSAKHIQASFNDARRPKEVRAAESHARSVGKPSEHRPPNKENRSTGAPKPRKSPERTIRFGNNEISLKNLHSPKISKAQAEKKVVTPPAPKPKPPKPAPPTPVMRRR